MVRERFGVDEDVCTGDHACIRLSGCPSLSVKHTDDPLKDDPVAAIDNNCVGCGNCGEVAEAAVLCPSFYRADIIHNPTGSTASWPELRARRDRLPAAPARGDAASPSRTDARPPIMNDLSGTPRNADALHHRPADLRRRSGHGRAGRRRAGPTGSSSSREVAGLARAVDLGAGRRPAHRRDDLLCRDAAAEGRRARRSCR